MVIQRTKEGKAFGVTFVDFKSKSAFKGSDLGKEYSVKGLEQRCHIDREETEKATERQKIRPAMRQRQTPSSGPGTRPAPSFAAPFFSPIWPLAFAVDPGNIVATDPGAGRCPL